MAATAVSLRIRPKRTPIANPSFLHFHFSSSSDTPDHDEQNTPPPPPSHSVRGPRTQTFDEIRKSLRQLNAKNDTNAQNRDPMSLKKLMRGYHVIRSYVDLGEGERLGPEGERGGGDGLWFHERLVKLLEAEKEETEEMIGGISCKDSRQGPVATTASGEEKNKKQINGSSTPSFEAIRENLRQLKAKNDTTNQNRDPMSLKKLTSDLNLRPVGPSTVIGETDEKLPASVFRPEVVEEKEEERESPARRTEFVRNYSSVELGERLRPEGKRGAGEDEFSLVELNERVAKLREAVKKVKEEMIGGISGEEEKEGGNCIGRGEEREANK